MIGELDRTRMREEAERVMREHPNAFTDSHLMAVFVVTLLDHMEAGGAQAQEEAWIGGTDPEGDERSDGWW